MEGGVASTAIQQRCKQNSILLNSDLPVIDRHILNDLEKDSEKLSASLDKIVQNLTKKLHETSAISVAYSQTYSQTVNGMGDEVDGCIRSMYLLITHCEEIDRAMKPCHEVGKKIQRIKNVLSLLETKADAHLASKTSELPI